MNNRIILANLAHDAPQVSINFGTDYKIVKFLDNGTHNPVFFENLNLKYIYCLVWHRKHKYSIISVSLDCWYNKKIKIETIRSSLSF